MLSSELRKKILKAQRNEIAGHLIYGKLAKGLKDKKKSHILERISRQELKHYEFWQSLTQEETKPDKLKIFFTYL